MGKLIVDTKQLYYDFMIYDEENGDCFVNNSKAEKSYNLTSAEKHFVKRYLSLIMSTSIISDSTKQYVRYYRIDSIRKIVKEVVNISKKKKNGKVLNENTMMAMIQYDHKKLLKYFDDDMLEKIKESTYKDISVYEEQLNLAIAKFGKASELKEHLALEVPLTEICGKLSDSDFNKLLNIIKPYSKGVMKQLIEVIPDSMKAYLNFLLYVEEKSQLDIDRYERLKKLLIDGISAEELAQIQSRFDVQAAEVVVSDEVEVIEKPKVEMTEADREKEQQLEEAASKEQFIPDFTDSDEDEPIDLTLGKENETESKEEGYFIGNDGLGKISTKGWVIK